MMLRSTRSRLRGYAAVAALALIFCLTAYRAFTTNITDDEASTYIFYAVPYRMFSLSYLRHMYTTCIANNHWLNTVMIHLADFFFPPYSEIAVRLPSLVTFAVYLAAVYLGWRRARLPLPAAAFLVSNYYLNEFYGLGRGYAPAHTFLFLALMSYGEWHCRGGERHLPLMLLFLSLSSMSNTVALLAYPAVGAVVLAELALRGEFAGYFRRHIASTAAFAAFTGLMAGFHLGATARDRALFTGAGDFLHAVVLPFAEMLATSGTAKIGLLAAVLGASLLSAAALIVRRAVSGKEKRRGEEKAGEETKRENPVKSSGGEGGAWPLPGYTVMLAIFILTVYLTGRFSMGYITGRAALPFWSLIVLGFGSLCSFGLSAAADLLCRRGERAGSGADAGKAAALRGRLRGARTAAGVLLAAAAAILFARKIDLTSTRDWPWDYGTRERVAAVYEEYGRYPEDEPVVDYADVFYINKYAPLYGQEPYPAKLYTDE